MAILEINDLHKNFAEKKILNGISLKANEGEIISILGPSGSGKSTFLRCINFLEQPSEGSIRFKNIKVSARHLTDKSEKQKIIAIRKKVAMVFQHFNLWSHMSVINNVTQAPIRVLKREKQKAYEDAIVQLKKVGMEDFADKYPNQLSGGQKQRVAIARALAMHPEVILFDEPTSSLDPELVQEVLKVIKELAKDRLTMLIVSHEIQFSKDVSDHTVFFYNGIIEEQGNSKEVFDNPRSVRFRQFLSSINLK